MNKNLKKLGLLIVAAIAMAMGVNSASALRIGDSTTITEDSVIFDSKVENKVTGSVSITKKDNSYTVTVQGTFKDKIVAESGDFVTINLNGAALVGGVYNDGTLTINGSDNDNSRVEGTLANRSGGDLYLNGGNYSAANIVLNGHILEISGLGTKIPANVVRFVTEKFKAVDNYSYYELSYNDANLAPLKEVLAGRGGQWGMPYSYVNRAATDVLKDTKWTNASFEVFKAAYEAAKELVDSESELTILDQDRVEEALKAYAKAYKELEEVADYQWVDQAIEAAEKKLADGIYTDKSIAALNAAIAAVVRDLPQSRYAEVYEMEVAIINATKALDAKADYSEVNTMEKVLSVLKEEDYTPESWANLIFVESHIDRDLGWKYQSVVDNYAKQLEDAITGLDRISNNQTVTPGDDEPSNPGTPGTSGSQTPENPGTTGDENNNSGSTVNPNTDGTTSDVNTGDNVAVYAVMNIASLIALAGCGLVLRKQN